MRRLAAAAMAAGLMVGGAATAAADPPYGSCADAAADGRSNIPKGDPGYSSGLDRDDDGIACES